jgi:hypothetical protein
MEPIIAVNVPDWKPLESVLSSEGCEEFMYMGRSGEIVLYKHSRTRRYLNIDRTTGRFYRYDESGMFEIGRDVALGHVYS